MACSVRATWIHWGGREARDSKAHQIRKEYLFKYRRILAGISMEALRNRDFSRSFFMPSETAAGARKCSLGRAPTDKPSV